MILPLQRFNCCKLFIRSVDISQIMFKCVRYKYAPGSSLINLFYEIFGISERKAKDILIKNIRLRTVTRDHIENVLEALKIFNICKDDVIEHPSVLIPSGKSLREHGRVLKECGFSKIKPDHLTTYYRLIKKNKIKDLKENNLLPYNMNIKKKLSNCLKLWPANAHPYDIILPDDITLFELRFLVLQKYLEWRLKITKERFHKIIITYNRFRHRPLADMEESINIAQECLSMTDDYICRHPFVISADPKNTMMILDYVGNLNGIDAKDALNFQPCIIKEDYKELIKVNNILMEHEIPPTSHKRVLPLFMLKPKTLESRFTELEKLPQYQALSNNKRLPLLLQYRNRVVERLQRLAKMNKRCTSLQMLVAPKKTFETRIDEFGDKSYLVDMIVSIYDRLSSNPHSNSVKRNTFKEILSRHIYFNHVPIVNVNEAMLALLETFSKQDILDNFHILLYSIDTIKSYLSTVMELKKNHELNKCEVKSVQPVEEHETNTDLSDFEELKDVCNSVDYSTLSNTQILSLVLYFIEKEHNFSGDGIWMNDRNLMRNNA